MDIQLAKLKIESVQFLPQNSMDGKAVNGGGNKPKSAPSSSPKSTAWSSPSEDLRCSFCSKHFTRKLDLAHHLESMHCRERCLYVGSGGKCGAVFTGKHLSRCKNFCNIRYPQFRMKNGQRII